MYNVMSFDPSAQETIRTKKRRGGGGGGGGGVTKPPGFCPFPKKPLLKNF